MIRENNENQLTLAEFDWPFLSQLDPDNRWVKLADAIPWEALGEAYHRSFATATLGRPAKPARMVIGAVIIKHKLVLSDRETIEQISENGYLQYFIGLSGFQTEKPFDASLFVLIRRRMGQQVFDEFQQTIIDEVERHKAAEAETESKKTKSDEPKDPPDSGKRASQTDGSQRAPSSVASDTSNEQPDEPDKSGRFILDATVVEQAIRFPTDLSLLNEAREFSEQIIDRLYAQTALSKKPRTYRVKARRQYLSVAKRRRAGARVIRKAIKQQLQYCRPSLVQKSMPALTLMG